MHSRGHCALHIYLVLFLRNFQQQFENYELNVSVWRVWYRLETVNNGDIWTFVGLFFCNLFLFLFSFFFQFVHHRCVYMVDITNDTATNMELFFFFFCDCLLSQIQRYNVNSSTHYNFDMHRGFVFGSFPTPSTHLLNSVTTCSLVMFHISESKCKMI